MKVELLKEKTVYGVQMNPGDEIEVRDEIGRKWIANEEAKDANEEAKNEKKSRGRPKKEDE